MKAISLLQPWASIVAIGEKQYETRGWETSFRGPIAIHASKGKGAIRDGHLDRIQDAGVARSLSAATLPLGAIVAVATVADCQPTDEVRRKVSVGEHQVGDWSPGRFCFKLERVVALPEPVAAAGLLGFWEVPPHIAEQVISQVSPDVAALFKDLVGAGH